MVFTSFAAQIRHFMEQSLSINLQQLIYTLYVFYSCKHQLIIQKQASFQFIKIKSFYLLICTQPDILLENTKINMHNKSDKSNDKSNDSNCNTKKQQNQVNNEKLTKDNEKSVNQQSQQYQINLLNQGIQKISISAQKDQRLALKIKKPFTFQKNQFFKKIQKNNEEQRAQKIEQKNVFEQRYQNTEDFELKNKYENDIISFLKLHKIPINSKLPLNFSKYCEICYLWKKKHQKDTIKPLNFISVKYLTFRAFGSLRHNEWLNDDIINIYIELLQKSITIESNIKVVNSYFATQTLKKQQHKIHKFLKNRNISKYNQLLIPINANSHWYFIYFTQNNLIIFDSLLKDNKQYQKNQIIEKLSKFGKKMYELQISKKVCINFPKQTNSYDCGIFMLLGIKDILNKWNPWSFKQEDIKFKRIQMAAEVLDEKLFPNQYNLL